MPQRRQATSRFLATVLFTDIVGSTERAAELGDRAWRELLEQHHAAVRHELKAFRGREISTSGDGFLALFEVPERAVRCAESIIARVGTLGLRVRAGVHTGECEVVGGEVAGMAVHIGSRVAALAGPGEVLVSGSVRDLMTGSDQRFTGGEARVLKGVAEPWRVYRLVPDQVNGVLPTQRRAALPLYTRRSRRRLLVVLSVVLAVALAVTSGYLLTRPADAGVVVGENAVGVIGPGDEPRSSVDVGQRPTAVVAGFGSVWVTNSTDDSVSRIDRRTRSAAPIPVGSSPSGVAVGAGSVWVANSGDGTVTRIDPTTGRPTTIDVRPGPTGIVVAFGSVWVTNALDASVTQIDPDTNTVAKVVPVGVGPTGIAAGAGYLWVTNQGDGTVTRFDPDTFQKDSPVTVGEGPVGIAISGDAAWVTNNLDGSLYRIDVEDLTVQARTLDKSGGAYGIAARGGDVWVSNQNAGTLMRVTAGTFRLSKTVPLRGAPLGLAYVGKDLWFTNAAGGSALHRGGVLTMVGTGIGWNGDPAVLDPLTLDDFNWRLAAMTHDGLVGFRKEAGAQGARLVPDLATTLPEPTDGGLTYTFHLRKGVRYSTGAPVLAGDIRRGIERTVAHGTFAGTYFYATAILGGPACRAAADEAASAGEPLPDCDLSEGIVADDTTGTVTFHLVEPTPDFVYQLALQNAAAVPQDTPLSLPPGTFVAATGPYMIDSYTPQRPAAEGRPARHGRLELVRNPHFREWSSAAQPEGYADRLLLTTGYTEAAALALVTQGRADFLWQARPLADVDRLRAPYGPQLHSSAGIRTFYVFLNATRPPFDDVAARRAVAFALDRAALARGDSFLSGPVTCQVLPPGVQGYQPYCPFTLGGGTDGRWAGPDVAAAEELVTKSGTRGAEVVFVTGTDKPFQDVARKVVQQLRRLGYRVSLVNDFERADDPHNDWNASAIGWFPDYPAASNYLVAVGSCIGSHINQSGLCDPAIDKMITAAYAQQVTDPGAASDAWAAIDRAVVAKAAVIPFSNNEQHEVVSRRVGNTVVHPLSGMLISQLWVQ